MEKKNSDIWRIIAIVFIVLFIVETSLLIWAFSVANEETEKENSCIDICEQFDEVDYYNYYSDRGVCECYKDGELIKRQSIPK